MVVRKASGSSAVQAVHDVGTRQMSLVEVGRTVSLLAVTADDIKRLVRVVTGEALSQGTTTTALGWLAGCCLVVGGWEVVSTSAATAGLAFTECSITVLGEWLWASAWRVVGDFAAGLSGVRLVVYGALAEWVG